MKALDVVYGVNIHFGYLGYRRGQRDELRRQKMNTRKRAEFGNR